MDFDSLEKLSPEPLTKEEIEYIELKKGLWFIEKELGKVNTQLCELVSSIGNIITKLNDMDNSIILRE